MPRDVSTIVRALVVSSVMATPTLAAAQSAWLLQGTPWTPTLSVDPNALPHVEGTEMPGRWNWNAGVAVQYLDRPYALATTLPNGSTQTSALVSGALWTNYLVQLGLGPSASVALELPVLLTQASDFSQIGQPAAGSTGFGDVRFVGRWSSRAHRTVPSPSAPGAPANARPDNTNVNEGPALGVVLSVTAPTGDPQALTGTGAWMVHPAVVGDFRLFGLVGAAQVGYRFRFDQYWPAQSGTCSVDTVSSMPTVSCFGDVPLHDAITYSLGLRIPSALLRGIVSPYFELFGAVDARTPGSHGSSPLEIGGGVQRVFGEITATLGAWGGVTDAPGNPLFHAMLLVQWAPRFIDEDGDGLRDNTGEDQCVGLPEDRDGYQDEDGCPEDNDTDEIPDAEDRCPNENEDVDGFQDEDGCPDPDNDQDGVLDTQDQCPNVPMGPDPDEHRLGCPSGDSDHDRVPDAQDQCPHEPAGATPDPARPGCPATDRDHDGVPDPIDACPDEPADANATAEQHGCPDADTDHDGVPNAHDRCPTQAETINGYQDDDGCPEAHAPPAVRDRVRFVRASPDDPGTLWLLEPVRFTAHDAVDPASHAVLDQLALALVATARRPRRSHSLTVAMTPASIHGAAAIDAARATRRRDAVLAYLHAHGAPAWAVESADPLPPQSWSPHNPDRGIVLHVVEHVATSSASPSPSASAAPSSASPTLE